jgi:hypothetical protein
MSRRSQQTGAAGEDAVARQLRAAGFSMVERVIVPFTVRRGAPVYLRRVSGDFRAIVPGPGTSVLVEAKARAGRLLYSDLQTHQRLALDAHTEAGGLSVLAWHNLDTGSVWLLRWPVWGFVPRSSLREPLSADLLVSSQ